MRAMMLLLVPTMAFALDTPRNVVTVTGSAAVERTATSAKVTFRISGRAEAAKDALVKYKQKADKLARALSDGGVAKQDVTVRPPAVLGGQADASQMQMVFQGRQGEETSPLVTVASIVEVRVAAKGDAMALVEAVTKVVDLVLEAGADNTIADMRYAAYYGGATTSAALGPSTPVITFAVDDGAGMRDEATAKAVEDAKARATAIAAKTDHKLGKVVWVREVADPSGDATRTTALAVVAAIYNRGTGDNEVSGSSVPLVTKSVQVEVGFALEQ